MWHRKLVEDTCRLLWRFAKCFKFYVPINYFTNLYHYKLKLENRFKTAAFSCKYLYFLQTKIAHFGLLQQTWDFNSCKDLHRTELFVRHISVNFTFEMYHFMFITPLERKIKSMVNINWDCKCSHIINRPGVAGAVLQTPSLLIKTLTDDLWKYLYSAATPWWLEMMLSVIK